MNKLANKLSEEQIYNLLKVLQKRFNENMNRHENLNWSIIEDRIKDESQKLWTLHQMEETGGEPDIVAFDENSDSFFFFDCSKESPKGRRSVCYDREALESRKKFNPDHSAIDMANEMGVELLTEEEYLELQKYGPFDVKTSSWLNTPSDVRELGGAIFGDHRFGRTFIYHNGAESYYAARGFRGVLKV